MSETRSPREVFLALINGVAAKQDPAEVAALYADQTDVTHPFEPARAPALRTRDELREHFARGRQVRGAFDRKAVDVIVHETADPEVIIGEFTYDGTNTNTGEHVRIPSIFVMRVRDGLIVESRDYTDPNAVVRAGGALRQ
ncbi:MAG TPA: nuclear transport factor 2 family protein [Pseudonocardiaceae bacterium]|nr:nuclear transport factor 2 family protein [Pseudonocardiaceae bacterium]